MRQFSAALVRSERARRMTAALAVLALLALTYACNEPVFQTVDDNHIVATASGAITGARRTRAICIPPMHMARCLPRCMARMRRFHGTRLA